jgi:17beta-estradiol 17-dehydrogenase / 3beta-hydroxysteroid 3-dehydrogenase
LSRWSERVALVTGGSSGIGRAVTTALVSAGMRVAASARRVDRLEALQAGLGDGSARFLPMRADLRREDDILSMFTQVRERWGGVDVLVNNAGLGHAAPLMSGATEHWREMLEVNVLALCMCTREAVTDMQRRNVAGQVIHISSMSAHRVPPGSGVYAATKYAVRALTEGLRKELRELDSPIRITAISPGFVETEFAAHYHKSEAAAHETYGRYPVLQPADVAQSILYVLAQPEHVQIHDILMRPTAQAT